MRSDYECLKLNPIINYQGLQKIEMGWIDEKHTLIRKWL